VRFLRLLAVWWLGAPKVHETTTLLLVTLCQIFTDFKKSTDRLSNRPILIWLLTTQSHLKCVATLLCNSSLIACFLTLIFHKVVWQHLLDVVRFLIICFAANLLENQPVEEYENRLRFDRDNTMSISPVYGTRCI